MKKFLCLTLAFLLAVGTLAGCGGNSDQQTTPENTTQEQTDAAATTQPTTGQTETLTLERDELTLVNYGETWTLYSGPISLDQITFRSENTAVATFEKGVVTAVGKGETVVHAEYNGQSVSCNVYCNLQDEPETTGAATEQSTNPGAGSRDPYLAPPTTEVVPASFFDDAVFVGDSVSLKLSYYAGETGLLGNAKFLVRGSYGVANAVYDELLMPWQGQEMKIEDAVQATGAKKMFVMLGMNDIALYGIDKTIENWGKLLERVRSKCPDMEIYIQSMSPIWIGGEIGDLNNTNIDAYNVALKAFAESNGCKFIDVAPYMKDSLGGLATPYCSDEYVHVTDAGVDTWIKVLKAYTGY